MFAKISQRDRLLLNSLSHAAWTELLPVGTSTDELAGDMWLAGGGWSDDELAEFGSAAIDGCARYLGLRAAAGN